MSQDRTACARWLALVCTFGTSRPTCYDIFRMVEVVMTHGAKTSARAGSWRLETQQEKRSRQPRGRNLFTSREQACLRATRRLGMAGQISSASLRTRRHLCNRAAWYVEIVGGNTVFVYMFGGFSRDLRHDGECDTRVCGRHQRVHGNFARSALSGWNQAKRRHPHSAHI